MRRANASRNDHGEELDAATADLAMYLFVGLGCVLCCSMMVLLHKGEVCAARRASHRRRPHSAHCGHKRGLRRAAPLLLLAAWLGVSSAKGITVCSVQPSVCSGTYSSPSLCAAPPPQPTRLSLHPTRHPSRSAIENQVMSGSMPTQLGALTALSTLRLEGNHLSGSLPTQLAALTSLENLSFDLNELSGSLPTQLAALTSLVDLSLAARYTGSNFLSGSLPTQLGALAALEGMYLAANELSGSLPTQLGTLTLLVNLHLEENNLHSSLPTQLGALTYLEDMYLAANHLSGSLPTQLAALTLLSEMVLEENVLSGSLPEQLVVLIKNINRCDLGGTNKLYDKLSCSAPAVMIPWLCTASLQQCVSMGGDSSDAEFIDSSDPQISSDAVPSEQSSGAVPLWALLPVGMLLVGVLVLFCRHYCRMSRDRSNLRLSRDRANLDLQIISHQVQRRQTQPNDLDSQPDSLSEQRYASLAGATVLSLPPGPPSSSAASTGGAAPASLSPDPTSSSNKEGKRKRKAGASNEVPLSWAEADRQFYASAAGKAYLAAGGTVSPSTAPSSSAASAPSAVRPSVEFSEQAVPQLCGVAPACHQPTSLRKKAIPRKFTSEGVEIHHLLEGARGIWDKHVGRRFEALSDAERTQQYRNKAPSSAPTPAPAPPPPLTARSAVVPTSDERSCAHWEAKDARAAAVPPERSAPPAPAPTPAPAIDQSVEPLLRAGTEQHCHAENAGAACDVAAWAAPSTPSGPEASSDVMVKLADLADLTELQDDEAVVALSNHLSPSGHWMP